MSNARGPTRWGEFIDSTKGRPEYQEGVKKWARDKTDSVVEGKWFNDRIAQIHIEQELESRCEW